MAIKDHSLDPRIIEAAKGEFLTHGYQKASLHKIAERAGITTGALYTRYKNKDDLFCSLVAPAMKEMAAHMESIQENYQKAYEARTADSILAAIRAEDHVYLELLFEHYDECMLLYCRSAGSSLQKQMAVMMEKKAAQSVGYFRSMSKKDIEWSGLEVLMAQQFYSYQQVLEKGYTKEQAVACMKTVEMFLEAGWKAVLDEIL